MFFHLNSVGKIVRVRFFKDEEQIGAQFMSASWILQLPQIASHWCFEMTDAKYIMKDKSVGD